MAYFIFTLVKWWRYLFCTRRKVSFWSQIRNIPQKF